MISSTGVEPTIVVVDDDEDSFWLMQRLFKRLGAQERMVWFSDGERALAHLKTVAERDRTLPMLLVLDLKMPGLDGFGVLRALKESPATAPLPVVVVSSSDLLEDIARALQLGALCYFEKYPLPEKLAPAYEIAKSRLPVATDAADPCEVALRRILALVETAVSSLQQPKVATVQQDEQLIDLLGSIRRRATGKLLERVNTSNGARMRWPFEGASSTTGAP